MKQYLEINEWSIVENGFHREHNKISESVFSLGNGRFGQRANFEEDFAGETMQGNYVAGVYYPDKTRVGWWKNGYPEYFAKVLNATNWVGIKVEVEGENFDLEHCEVRDFNRELNMREGYLQRSFIAKLKSGKEIKVVAQRFCSIVNDDLGAIRYAVTPLNFSGNIKLTPYLDGDIKNQDANYDEKFWDEVNKSATKTAAYLTLKTRKTGFEVCTGMRFSVSQNGQTVAIESKPIEREKYVANEVTVQAKQGEEIVLFKYAAIVSSLNHTPQDLLAACKKALDIAERKGFQTLLQEQAAAWATKWEESDIVIEGDAAAQQAIRFNIFQLNQTYTGEDERLNIGPKGFTGEKYGGSTYWDTEAYCIPFYLATADQKVAKNLLLYRYKQLDRAIENAGKLGFKEGAALYPMVTMNGEECHNEWEITFEEIHRNGAIAFAIYDYIRYTGDEGYLTEAGAEVLTAIARFWSQRVNWSSERQKYVMLGVTGPNEYENNVNNNWYTNYIACWCMEYAAHALKYVSQQSPEKYAALTAKINFKNTELEKWSHIVGNMHYPEDKNLGIYLQQDGYLDKEQILVKDLPVSDRPLNQKWSWDRILRSCFIKQADVLQGLFCFEDKFDIETIRRNFDFYEPRTVHESSLSPCVHSVLAAKLGDEKRAYEFYLRTSRLDLDDYNNDTEDGCHTTSMAGTWMSVVQGFGGMRVRNGQLHFAPFIPGKWNSFSFKVGFRGSLLKVKSHKNGTTIQNQSDKEISLFVYEHEYTVAANSEIEVRKEDLVSSK
ncbi:glycoside hydrolase family 65 protein [Solitalea sp. MAHUQ-68]|uniref:Glycoside hydrolase family 65 protein n=1 Tax=Solitalea agri TaxID=2953739 RepID=A0A9X2JAZ0_9SPHI|nr:glycoside hydrolase family 65 protein [Solitalea agri]MCO4291458.1 glycoside hydrolase family 65 protein [Solitalea agri]